MIGALERLGTLPAEVAKIAAPLVHEAITATVRAGADPSGKKWAAKKDGGAPLVHAADSIETRAVGTVIRTTLRGPTVFHHFGARGAPRRTVLPDPGTIPPAVERALERAAALAWERADKR